MTSEDIDKIATRVQELIKDSAPMVQQTYELGLTTLQIDAGAKLTFGLISAGALIVLVRHWRKFLKKDDYPDELAVIGRCLVSVLVGIFALAGLFYLFDVWMWVKLFKPELWLIHSAVEKIVN